MHYALTLNNRTKAVLHHPPRVKKVITREYLGLEVQADSLLY